MGLSAIFSVPPPAERVTFNRFRCPNARARGGRAGIGRIGRGCAEQTDRLEPAVRLLTDVADSF
jgi:hypothetical protein